MQFSSSCDIVASLMKIPQFFLPECINTEDTQVYLPALLYTYNINGRLQEYIKTVISNYLKGDVESDFICFH